MIVLYCCYISVFAILAVYGAHRLYLVLLYSRHKQDSIRPTGLFHKLPFVTIQLPLYNERFVATRLIDAVAKLRYPRDRLEIQVLDDSQDDTQEIVTQKVDELCQQGIDIQVIRRSSRKGFKAGALAEGMKSAKGEFIAIFDADFIPKSDFLEKTIHYFKDPQIGMVQTRWVHLNKTYSFFTQAQAILLDGHFVVEHTARHRSGRFFNFNGTAGLWRKSAISEAGGWQGDTLTEDLDLSYRAQLKGWKFVYLPHVTAPAELPLDVQAFKRQQQRWSKGAIQTAKKLLVKIWKSRNPLGTKLEATFHLTDSVTYCFAILLFLLLSLVMVFPTKSHWTQVFLIDIPMFMIVFGSMCTFYIYAQKQVHSNWIERIKYVPSAVLLGIGISISMAKAIIEAVLGQQSPFIRTPKLGVRDGMRQIEIKKSLYRVRSDKVLWVEFAFSIYFLLLFVYALSYGNYTRLPFIFILFLSFGGVWFQQIYPVIKQILLKKRFELLAEEPPTLAQNETA